MPFKIKFKIHYYVMLATALIIIFATRYSSVKIWDKLQLQIEDTLQIVSLQNSLTAENELHAKQDFLYGLAKQLPNNPAAKKDQVLKLLQPFTAIYNVKRFGFVDPNGNAYTTDGHNADLSGQDFFEAGMQGKSYITDIREDDITEAEQINVFSVPVYHQNGNMISGVLFATYRTTTFNDLLDTECFDGNGYSCIIKQSGRIVMAAKHSPFYKNKNIFYTLRNMDNSNLSGVSEMETAMEQNKSGLASCNIKGSHYIYYMPLASTITDSQWYLLTIVPASVLTKRLDQVFFYVKLLLAIIVIVLLAAFFYYVYTYWAQKKQLTTLAYVDPLTNGDNYASFKEKMKKKKGTSGYIISTDIFEFRIINNICGVQKGNEVLQHVWQIICRNLSEHELAAHIHADRFIFFWADDPSTSITERIEQINEETGLLAAELNTPRIQLYLGIYHTDKPEQTEEGYGCANQAKHAVKTRMDKNYSLYEEINFKQWLENHKLEDGFEEAIQNHRFEIWYQPKYSTKDQNVVSAEALVRWRDVDGNLIPPYKFIPLFEQNGMISVLDEYVFDAVCAQQRQWQSEGKHVLPVSVNISRSSLYYSTIVKKYAAILNSYELPAQNIQLEITESAAVDNSEIMTLIDQFHEIGFHLLLDDFGTGYSSLSTLNQMHFDTLKLDKSLIDHIGDTNGEKLLYYIIKLAQSLGLKITAEGVEYKNQFEFLQQLACDDIQGYYFSKPLPSAEYAALL